MSHNISGIIKNIRNLMRGEGSMEMPKELSNLDG